MKRLIPSQIYNQLEQACDLLRRIAGADLLAIHLYGSAVDGGLKPQSDLDLLVTLRQPLSEQQREALMQALPEISTPPGQVERYRALEVTIVVHSDVVPWRFPPMREMQFGEWLRDEIAAGRYEGRQQDGDLAILITKARNNSIALLGESADRLFDEIPVSDLRQIFAQTLTLWNKPADVQGEERHIILTLARIWYSVANGGDITSKEAAASWLLAQLPADYGPVLESARRIYLGLEKDSLAERPDEVMAFVSYTRTRISELLNK